MSELADLWSLVWAFPWASLLGVSALILSIVNGLILIRGYTRDKPCLVVKPIYPEVYQWFFRLPSVPLEGQATTKFGLLAYLEISNKGLRDVSMSQWNLHLKTATGKKVGPLNSLNITEPRALLGQSTIPKFYPVLGQKGQYSPGETMVKSGDMVSGFAYYIYEYVGGNEWTIIARDGTVSGEIIVTDVFGKRASVTVVFREVPLDKAKSYVPDIEKADAEMTRQLPIS